jgi:hypothetical protein
MGNGMAQSGIEYGIVRKNVSTHLRELSRNFSKFLQQCILNSCLKGFNLHFQPFTANRITTAEKISLSLFFLFLKICFIEYIRERA